MRDPPELTLLPHLQTRKDYFDFLDHWSVGTVDELQAQLSTHALVKAYLLETSRSNGSRDSVAAVGAAQQMSQIDDHLYRVRQPGEAGDWAILEVEDARYPVIYTAIDSETADRRVDQIIEHSALLDRTWFAAPMFERLWQLVLSAYPGNRFSQIVFEHESVFEATASEFNWALDDALGQPAIWRDERRRARIQITERIGRLAPALDSMRDQYDPLRSVVRLRVPASRRGGHDVFFNGRFTNRSDSVTSLRQTVLTVAEIYQHVTTSTEDASWPRERQVDQDDASLSMGAPVLIKFSAPLEESTFVRWIASLRRKNNRFRLWGTPIERGPGKVHLHAVDNHLWQPIDLELTRDHVYALLPEGTCGNTIHRLVANIQRFVDPKISTFIGERPYEELIAGAPSQATFERKTRG